MMGRSPFNPDQVTGRRGAPRRTEGRDAEPLSVTQLACQVRDVLAEHLPATVAVVGEVSNLADRTHWFFSLKDEESTLRCVMFASSARKADAAGLRIENGQQVVVYGRIDFFGAQGQLQLYIDRIQPIGQGPLEIRFRQLCEQLRQRGFFDADRKKRLPLLPTAVAVVTSKGGAALQDVIKTARKRWSGCRLMLMDVRVQGDEAAPQIAGAIRTLSSQGGQLGIDAVVLTRGGGSMEDLWAFNEPEVAESIYRCRIPVVAAIGHETDTTIAELVADVRCSTPTQAAMQVVPDARSLEDQIEHAGHRLTTHVSRHFLHARQRLEASCRHPVFRRPLLVLKPLNESLTGLRRDLVEGMARRLVSHRQQIDAIELTLGRIEPRSRLSLGREQLRSIQQRLRMVLVNAIASRHERLTALTRQLEALGPLNVLDRGYSYTLGPDGRPLRSINDVEGGDHIMTALRDGRFRSTVERGQGGPRPSSGSRGARGRGGQDQLDLFS